MKAPLTPRSTATLVAALLIGAPAALAVPIDIGSRNPAGGASATSETQIIANTTAGTYGTRQSNKGNGGGAIYGCRTPLNLQQVGNPDISTACIRVNNLEGGKAFDFVFDSGPVGGIIQSGGNVLVPNPKAAPFVTNATAVALGLNADRVDGQNAADIVKEARTQAGLDAEKVGGLTPAQIVAQAQTGGGACATTQVAAGDACIEKAPRTAATFDAAAAVCGKAGMHLPTAAELTYARTLDGVDLGSGEMASDVTAGQSLPIVGGANTYATVADDGTVGSSSLTTTTAYRCIQG